MRFTIATIALWASAILASPASESGYSIRREGDDLLPIGDMSWTGPIFPGGPEQTIYGTAKSIYEQIMELNPGYNAFDFPDIVEEFAKEGITKENFNETFGVSLETRSLEARASIACNHGNWIGNWLTQCGEGYDHLKKLTEMGRRCTAEKYKCARVSCSNNCGMYYCNNNKNKAISAKCYDIAKDAKHIANSCPYSNTFAQRVRGRKSFANHYVELSSVKC